jgi:hypothetical protein
MNCKEINSTSEIVLKAPKRPSEMRFNNVNKKEITKINLDFCKERKEKHCDYKTNEICPTKKGKFCDYLIIDEKGTEYFIELKGKKVLDACEQIEETIKKLSKNYPNEKPFFAFIIPVSVSPKINPTIQNWRSKMRTKYKCTLIVQNKSFEQELN